MPKARKVMEYLNRDITGRNSLLSEAKTFNRTLYGIYATAREDGRFENVRLNLQSGTHNEIIDADIDALLDYLFKDDKNDPKNIAELAGILLAVHEPTYELLAQIIQKLVDSAVRKNYFKEEDKPLLYAAMYVQACGMLSKTDKKEDGPHILKAIKYVAGDDIASQIDSQIAVIEQQAQNAQQRLSTLVKLLNGQSETDGTLKFANTSHDNINSVITILQNCGLTKADLENSPSDQKTQIKLIGACNEVNSRIKDIEARPLTMKSSELKAKTYSFMNKGDGLSTSSMVKKWNESAPTPRDRQELKAQ